MRLPPGLVWEQSLVTMMPLDAETSDDVMSKYLTTVFNRKTYALVAA